MQVLGPDFLGHPYKRSRRISVLTLHSTCSLPKGLDNLSRLAANVVSDCGLYFLATDAEVDSYRLEACRQAKSAPSASWVEALKPAQKIILDSYRNLPFVAAMLQDPGCTVVANLYQNPHHMRMCDKLMPCLLKGGLLWNLRLNRAMVPSEYFRTHLIIP